MINNSEVNSKRIYFGHIGNIKKQKGKSRNHFARLRVEEREVDNVS